MTSSLRFLYAPLLRSDGARLGALQLQRQDHTAAPGAEERLFELARPLRRRVPTGQELQSARDHSHPGATGYGSCRAPTARSARPVVAASTAVEPRPEGRAVPEAGP